MKPRTAEKAKDEKSKTKSVSKKKKQAETDNIISNFLHDPMNLSGIINSAMDAIITIDSNQSVVLFNESAEKMFGYPASEALGQPIGKFMPERFRFDHQHYVRQFGETHQTKRSMGHLGSIFGLRSDGKEFPIE